MKKKFVSLYIDDSGLKLTMVRRGQVKRWASLAFEPGTLNGLVAADQEKFSIEVSRFLHANKISGKRIDLAISGVNSLTRQITLPSLPRNLLEEAVIREARRVLPLPIEQVHLAWQPVPAPEDKVQVFLVAVMRVATDSIFGALKSARVKVDSMTIKPLALSRLVNKNAILIDVQAGDLDIVMVFDGIPQPIRSVPFPPEASTWQARFPIVIDELERTIQFYQATYPDRPLAPDMPVYVSGEMAKRNRFWPRIKERFGFEVVAMESPLPAPEGFDPQDYLVNVALSLPQPDRLETLPVTSVNLLPTPYRAQPVKWERIVTAPVALGLVGIIVPLAIAVMGTNANIGAVRKQVDATNNTLQQRQTQTLNIKKDLKTLEENLAAARQKSTDAAKVLTALEQHALMINEDLATINALVAGGVNLAAVNFTDAEIGVKGTCNTEAAILAYARALYDSGRFADTVVAQISKDIGPAEFSLRLIK